MTPVPRPPLTRRQREILTFITEYIDGHGWAPSIREILTATDFKSTSSVARQLQQLWFKGYIVRDFKTPRAMRLIP